MKRLNFILLLFAACKADVNESTLYEPFSTSVIKVTYTFKPLDTPVVSAFAYTNIPNDQSQSQKVIISSPGVFFLHLDIDRPTKSFVNVGSTQYNVFIFPHDTTHIAVNSSSEFDISFTGRSSKINAYYLEKKKLFGYTEPRFVFAAALPSHKTYDRVKEFVDSVTRQELSFLSEYHSIHDLPPWFQDYENAEAIYLGAGYKTYIPIINKNLRSIESALPPNYFDYLKGIEINNDKGLLSSFYFMFLSEYFSRTIASEGIEDLNPYERTSKFAAHNLTAASGELTGRVKELYELYAFSNLARFLKDSAAVDSAAREFGIDPTPMRHIAGSRTTSGAKGPAPVKGDTIPDFTAVNRLDSLISIRDFQDKIVFINFWASWCGPCLKDIPEINNLITTYEANPEVVFLNVCIDDEKSKWLKALDNYGLKGLHVKAEGNWNNLIRSYFAIQGIPHHTILAKGNIVHENFAGISEEMVDVLLVEKK